MIHLHSGSTFVIISDEEEGMNSGLIVTKTASPLHTIVQQVHIQDLQIVTYYNACYPPPTPLLLMRLFG